jgi:hypothetical protein
MTITTVSGYPKLKISNSGGRQLVDARHAADAESLVAFEGALPGIGGGCPYDGYDDLEVVDIDIQAGPTSGWFLATITYAPGAGSTPGIPDTTEYTLEDGAVERALEQHPDYRMIWNHHLAMRTDKALGDYTDYEAATDHVVDPDDAQWVRWVKSPAELPAEAFGERWRIVANRTKDAEVYIYPAPVVCETRYFSAKGSADTAAETYTVGTIDDPGETFGISTGEWLVRSKSLAWNGKAWVLQTRFQWADDWDGDFYASA